MIWTVLGITITVAIGALTYFATGTVATGMNALAWSFTIYMVLKLVFRVPLLVPKKVSYRRPQFESIPNVIDRENLPEVLEVQDNGGAAVIHNLIVTMFEKIVRAADETAIHAFLGAKLTTIRRQVEERYGPAQAEVDTLAFEGAIGTVLGMMVFLAQTAVMFALPDADSGNFENEILENLRSINLYAVMTALITSLIGWSAKAWIGRYLDDRVEGEMSELTKIEAWILDVIIARLHLPSQVSTYLTLQATSELAQPLVEAMQGMQEVVDDLRATTRGNAALAEQFERVVGPRLERMTQAIEGLEGGTIGLQMIEGGFKLSVNGREQGGRR